MHVLVLSRVATVKAVFHCSRFARAGGANMFQLLLWVSNLSAFCLLLCAQTRFMEVELHLTDFLGVPTRLIFHEIKIGRSVRADKATAMENGLKKCRHVKKN